MNESVDDASVEALVSEVTDDFLERLDRGEAPEIEDYAQRYPEIGGVLRQVLPALVVLRSASGDSASDRTTAVVHQLRCLGDYRIVREVGRGGMGVVYEAEQISLARRVALKVLPFAAALDSKRLLRFQNEARAVAQLHHSNIVPVFGVGCERGVHFYAMQFIEGQTLAGLIRELQEQAGTAKRPPRPAGDGPAALDSTTLLAALGTEPSKKSSYFRAIARLGVQAASGLEYAHQRGVIHRDIKPANLLADATGNLWITDFGLAFCQGQPGLTMTGDLLGTLRYMSPEQALAKGTAVDQRTDIYSLGATLYELMVLQPVFAGDNREALLRQITLDEPVPLRRRNKTIPAELETIILKALEKNPNDRYASAQEFAEDLQRHLQDEPIRARRPSLRVRAMKWARRHKPVVAVAVSVSLTLLVAAVVGAFLYAAWVGQLAQERIQVNQKINVALAEASRLEARGRLDRRLGAGDLARAREITRRAETLAEHRLAELALVEQVRGLRARLEDEEQDRRMLASLEEGWLEQWRIKWVPLKQVVVDLQAANDAYAKAFRNYGIDVDALPPAEAATRITVRDIWTDLVSSVDEWAWHERDQKRRERLLAIARAADREPWRDQLRAATSLDELVALSKSAKLDAWPVGSLLLLKSKLAYFGGIAAAEELLVRTQRTHLEDFKINHALGCDLFLKKPPDRAGAIRFLTAAAVLRPEYSDLRLLLGIVLEDNAQGEDAIAAFRDAIRLRRHNLEARYCLSSALRKKGELDAALAVAREAVNVDPKVAASHRNLGDALRDKGQREEAKAEYQRAEALQKTAAGPGVSVPSHEAGPQAPK